MNKKLNLSSSFFTMATDSEEQTQDLIERFKDLQINQADNLSHIQKLRRQIAEYSIKIDTEKEKYKQLQSLYENSLNLNLQYKAMIEQYQAEFQQIQETLKQFIQIIHSKFQLPSGTSVEKISELLQELGRLITAAQIKRVYSITYDDGIEVRIPQEEADRLIFHPETLKPKMIKHMIDKCEKLIQLSNDNFGQENTKRLYYQLEEIHQKLSCESLHLNIEHNPIIIVNFLNEIQQIELNIMERMKVMILDTRKRLAIMEREKQTQ
ncbi:hypothetical protein pb186bvf_015636 [Paramecium bursaria]